MAAANSTTLMNIIGAEYKEMEAGKKVPFWPDDPGLQASIKDVTEFGGGEGDGASFYIPIEIDGNITTTVSNSYTGALSSEDVTISAKMSFSYQWIDQAILVYKREMDLAAKAFKGILQFRLRNAGSAYAKKILTGWFQGDGSTSATFAGLPSIWYDTTYGGLTRATYAERLDCANANTKLDGTGNGTKYTTPTSLDGETIYNYIMDLIFSTAINGKKVDHIYCDMRVYGALRKFLGSSYIKTIGGNGGSNTKLGPGASPKEGLDIEGATLVGIDSRLITAGHVFGICTDYLGVFSAKNAPLLVDGPFNEVAVSTAKGGPKSIQFQGSGRVVSIFPTANFWATGVGQA